MEVQRDTAPPLKPEGRGRLEKTYDTFSVHDDPFDMAEAALSMAIALFGVARVFAGFGIPLGSAGYFGRNLHPDWLAKLLG